MRAALKKRVERLYARLPRLPVVVMLPPEIGTRRTDALARIAQAQAEGRHCIVLCRDGDPEGER